MKKEIPSLPDAEFEVMDAVWDCDTEFAPTTDILTQMKTEKKAQTVLTMLTRLSDKGFVSSQKNGKERLWKAEISKSEYRSCEAKRIVEKIYGGSFYTLINAFWDGTKLSNEEANELSAWLEREQNKNR